MIIARCPLRISLGGGGTDLASYYKKNEGFLVAGAINKYIYVALHKTFQEEFIAKYSKIEREESWQLISHPIIHEVFNCFGNNMKNIEITSFADIPGGTGLGSSSAFTNSLIKAVFAANLEDIHNLELAAKSCHIEIDRLGEPIGKQDQYITALGGVREITFMTDDTVKSSLIYSNPDDCRELASNLVMVFTGISRSASSILADQKNKSETDNKEMIENLHKTKLLGIKSAKMLKEKKYDEFGLIMHEHWQNKKARSPGMSQENIDSIYELGLKNGANGGKVIGAGGGGFILFQSSNSGKLKNALRKNNLRVIDFDFVQQGCELINL